MTEMRVVTVRQPWASAIIEGGKDVENRSKNIAGDWTGTLAIHAGLEFDSVWHRLESGAALHAWLDSFDPGEDAWKIIGDPKRLGVIIGVVDLVGEHFGGFTDHYDNDVSRAIRCSRWAESDAHHLELKNPRALHRPIPFKGSLGMRRLPDTITAQIEHQLVEGKNA